jgi:hypothetical protein
MDAWVWIVMLLAAIGALWSACLQAMAHHRSLVGKLLEPGAGSRRAS